MVSTFVLAVMLAQHPELRAGPPFSKDSAVRLAYMKDSVTPYRIHRTAAGSPPFRLIADPIFRLDNPVSQVKDSAIFLWTDPATGRPEATIQMFRAPTGYWIHDWTSLSAGPIVAEVGRRAVWRPGPGLAFRPVPEAPAPAATPQARFRQLRAMAEEFSATDNFLGAGWSHAPAPAEALAPLRQGRFGGRGGCLVRLRDRDRPRGVPHDRVPPQPGRRLPMGVCPGPDDLIRGQGLVEGK